MQKRFAMMNKTPFAEQAARFCGCDIPQADSDPLLPYIIGVLKNEPVPPPPRSYDQWLSFIMSLGGHSVPLLYRMIRSLPSGFHPPRRVVEWMRIQFLRSKVRSLCVCRQLSEMTSFFHLKGIRALVLKGAAFGRTIYPDPALRCSNDIDILVHPENFFRACNLLEKSGYHSSDKIFDPVRKTHIEQSFSYSDGNKKYLPVDLHRDLHSCLRFNSEAEIGTLFDRAVRVEGPGFSFNALHPVDSLIYASLHWTLHHPHEFRLIWVYDIALLSRALAQSSQWSRLQERSVDMHARLAVERCLELARAWTGLRLPSDFEDFSTWPKADALEKNMDHHIPGWRKSTVSTFKYYWPAHPSFSETAWHLIRILFPSPRYMKATHPPSRDWLLPVSYLKRWMKWIHRLKA